MNNERLIIGKNSKIVNKIKENLIKIRKLINKDFKTFTPIEEYLTFDSQHINGGIQILNNEEIKELLKLKKKYIAGFPAKIEDDDFHPTQKFILKEQSINE